MSQIEIRPVTEHDQAAWLELWQGYLCFYKAEIPDNVSQNTWQRLLNPNEPTHSALAWKDGKAIGMVNYIFHRTNWTIENTCYLQDLMVDLNERGHGVGRQLIEFVYAEAQKAGSTKVYWLTHETNAPAIKLYEHVAERPGFIQFRKML